MKAQRRFGMALTSSAVVLALLLPPSARADNNADEAELQFELAADAYKAGDYRAALEHFLASNRLVPNRNVIFDIARTYGQLKQNADAYRYFNQALEGETDAATRAKIQDSISKILPLIVVLRIDSEPPGAAVFLDRRDLGARGNAPLTLGVAPGKYRVLADLPGYESAEEATQDLVPGTQAHVVVRLKQILGGLRVDGEPSGAAVRIDDDHGPVLCTLPCQANVAPGRHTLFVSSPGHQVGVTTATVAAGTEVRASVTLAAVTGTLLVDSEVRDAVVTVDGKARGFTPSALSLPTGPHRVAVTRPGYRPVEQTVEVTADTQARLDADLVPVEEVTAASRVTEAAADAPSSVTILTAQELRAMAYPTIAEALRGVRGVFVGDDTSYGTVGFRGFAPLGDYGDHVLVLVDGMPTNDDYVGSSYVGYDGRADIDDIQRIEIVRGPGSALYGTGAFFGVINLVTRDRAAPTHGELAVSTSDAGVGHARATTQVRLSPDAGGWMSVAAAHGSGRDFFFPEYASDPATGGNARGVDGFDTGTVNGRVWYKDLTVQWLFTSRKKTLPTAEFATVFGDPRTHFADTRGLVEVRYEPTVGRHVQLLSRAHANLYNFDDFLAYSPKDGGNATEAFRGRWVGFEQRVIWSPVRQVRVTLGGEVQDHLETKQTGSAEGTGTYLDRDDPFTVLAGYAVMDWDPAAFLKFSGGARLDHYSNFGSSANPRGAIILRPYKGGNLKIMGGSAFRAPSVYEHFYTGTTQVPSPGLKPERVASGEVELTHSFSSTVSGVVAGYYNRVNDLIVLGGGGTVADPNVYTNSTTPVETVGGEIEIRRDWRNGWMAAANYAYQHTSYVNAAAAGLRQVPNSPEHLGSVKGAAPILGSGLTAMTRISFQGPRYDRNESVGGPPQNKTEASVVWDIVLSGHEDRYGIRYALGLYNAMDYRYSIPVSPEFLQDTIVQNGRTVLASTQVSF